MESRPDDLTTRMEREDHPAQGGMPRTLDIKNVVYLKKKKAPRPLHPDTKPVTEALTRAQIQDQYCARSEKDEGYEAPITKEEPTHKGCVRSLPKSPCTLGK